MAHLGFLSYTTSEGIQEGQDGFPHFGGKTTSRTGASGYQLLPYQSGTELYPEFESVPITLPSLATYTIKILYTLKSFLR